MRAVVVVENVKTWPLRLQSAQVISARDYLMDPDWASRRGVTVYNLCRTYGYQTRGYYVSLLAAARGHHPLPSVETVQALRLSPVLRVASDDLDDLIQRSLTGLRSRSFELSIYFGRNLARRYDRLSRALFEQFRVPFLRASFERDRKRWRLVGLRLIAASEIPPSHIEFVEQQAERHFSSPRRKDRPKRTYRYSLAILVDPEAVDQPSDETALRRFARAAQKLDMEPTFIGRDDYGRVAEFDALFLRETTYVNHHTYRFARRARAEGLVVLDSPDSILRCTNKVYQAELLARHGIPTPRTMVLDEEQIDEVERAVGFPCVLKRPDSAFSLGVVKASGREELEQHLAAFFEDSELVIAQAWTPSAFDWRVGVLDHAPLFACRYHMARGHWQAVDGRRGTRRYGRVEAVPLAEVAPQVVDLGARSAGLIGDGLYGVDLKQLDDRVVVMEINDNPNVDAGCEDAILKEELYLAIMRWFRARLDARGATEAA